MAHHAIDASDPDHPLFPSGTRVIKVSSYIVALLYHPDDYGPETTSIDSLLFGSGHAQRIAEKAARLNDLVKTLRLYLAKGVYVLIRGWKPAFEAGWDKAAVQAFKGSLQQPVQYQGKCPLRILIYLLTLITQTPESVPR